MSLSTGFHTTHARTRHHYNRISGWYDALFGWYESRFKLKAVRRLGARPGETHLEIGCGTGKNLAALAEDVGSAGCVVGMDIAEGMLRQSRRRLESLGLLERVRLVQADAYQVPLKSQSCDGVFMSFVLELMPLADIPLVLGECRRVLKPGGRLVVLSLSAEGREGMLGRLYRWGRRIAPGWLDCMPIAVERTIRDSGFQVVHKQVCSFGGLPVEEVLARRGE